MELPSFNEFLSSIDVDDLAKKYVQQTRPHIIQLSPQDVEALGNAISIVYQDAVLNSIKCMKVFLAEYHAWLSKQL